MLLLTLPFLAERLTPAWSRVEMTALSLARWFTGEGTHAGGTVPERRDLPIPLILGYYYSYGPESAGYTSLSHYRDILNGIVPFWYTIQPDGRITGRKDPWVIRFARRNHLLDFALIQNMNGPTVYRQLLENPVNRARALRSILALLERDNYDGVNLDFEGISPADRRDFSSFVASLGRLLHDNGYYLTVSVPAETADEPGNSWTGAYDYQALGRSADLLMPMAYDEHYQGGPPGNIADRSWVAAVLRYTVSVVPPSKVVLGIPTYGYDWSLGPAKALSYYQAARLAQRYNHGDLESDHFAYYREGFRHQVWYENTRTFWRKVALVQDFEIRGIVLWRLGIEDPRIWPIIRG